MRAAVFAVVCAGVCVSAGSAIAENGKKSDKKAEKKTDKKKSDDKSDKKKAKDKKTAANEKKSDKKSKKDKGKKGKRESTAVGRDHKFAADNMPHGWSWPPTTAMKDQEKVCESKLDELGVHWAPGTQDGRIVDAVVLSDMAVDGVQFVGYSSAKPSMDCQLALAWANFAPTLYELGVREVHFGSVFRWTKVRAFGKTENMLSRHSIGIAMDIVSFVDASGREAVVGHDYKKGDQLLLDVETAVNASGLFRILLTPKNDPRSHSDHFHIETNIDFTPDTQLGN